jgi:hypothetical protein
MPARKYDIPDEFLAAADKFVALANEMGEDVSRDWVRAVMMYATARYNAFTWITGDKQPGQTVDQAAAYYRNEYETMFRENVTEIEPVYRAAQGEQPR